LIGAARGCGRGPVGRDAWAGLGWSGQRRWQPTARAVLSLPDGRRPTSWPAQWSAGPVGVTAVVGVDHADGARLVVDLVEHPVGAASGRPQADELALQRLADPVPGSPAAGR